MHLTTQVLVPPRLQHCLASHHQSHPSTCHITVVAVHHPVPQSHTRLVQRAMVHHLRLATAKVDLQVPLRSERLQYIHHHAQTTTARQKQRHIIREVVHWPQLPRHFRHTVLVTHSHNPTCEWVQEQGPQDWREAHSLTQSRQHRNGNQRQGTTGRHYRRLLQPAANKL